MKKTSSRAQDVLALACGGCMILIILLITNRDYPFVGHDYAYFIPHIIDTELHIRINGFTIQWYTPSFGGGLPGFPNPQHMEYSIVQLLSLWMGPWSAVLVSSAAISLIGYYFFYRFLSERLELNRMSSILGSLFFVGNGFYIEHLIAGQMGYQLFPLGAIILYALTDRRGKYIYNGAIIAIVITLMVFQAGFYLIVILILSFGIAFPLLHLYKAEVLNLRNITLTVISAVILSAGMTASKIYAVTVFMSHFPRELFDTYNIGVLQGGVGLITQLLGAMVLTPALIVTGQNPELLTGILSTLTGARYGIWETDIGLPPVLIIFLFMGLVYAVTHFWENLRLRPNRSVLIAFILLAFPVWITVELTLAKGLIYSFTKQLPILKSLHINVRFASAFILPLVIVGAFELERFFSKNQKPLYFGALTILTLASLLSYFSLPSEVHQREFNVSHSTILHEQIQGGSRFPITYIADIKSLEGFLEYASSYRPYEPIFGYHLEQFTPETHYGKILEVRDGYFNMTNPASFVFPEINNLHPFERFKTSEQDKLEAFLERKQPEWNIPVAQKILNIFSFIALIFSAGVPFTASVLGIISAARQKNTI